MKHKVTLCLFIFLLALPGGLIAQSTNDTAVAIHASKSLIDTELIQSQILLTDATLDLNRTLLQGIQASLDSLNVKDKNVIDEKNISLTIHRMQRQRDKAVLTPVLLHMRDSLQNEITRGEKEKADFEKMLSTGHYLQPVHSILETKTLVKDTVSPVATKYFDDTATAPVKPIVKEQAATKKDTLTTADTDVIMGIGQAHQDQTKPADEASPFVPLDTVVAENKTETVEVKKDKPGKPKQVAEVVQPAHKDSVAVANIEAKVEPKQGNPSHIRPVIDANPSTQPEEVPATHWETAKAIYYGDDSAQSEQNSNDLTAAKPAVNAGGDTTAYHPEAGGTDKSKPEVSSEEAKVVRARYFYTRALKDVAQKNYNEAISYLKRSIDLSPKYYDAWLTLGEADAHLGYYTKALNEFRYCKTIDSSKATLFYKMAMVQLKLKQKTGALADFNTALKLNPEYIPAIIGRALEYVDRGQYKTAIKEYNRVLQLDAAYHSVYKQRAMAYYLSKNYEAAIDDFSRYLIFNETDGAVYYHRGMARLAQNQDADACADLTVAAKLGNKAGAKALAEHCK